MPATASRQEDPFHQLQPDMSAKLRGSEGVRFEARGIESRVIKLHLCESEVE